MRKQLHAIGRSRKSERGFLAAVLILAGCSFDTNELKGYPGIDSSAATDGPSRGIDGQNGILDGNSDAGPRDSAADWIGRDTGAGGSTTGTGGATGTGGIGGILATGGVVSTGGATPTGGVSMTGGVKGSGGVTSTGGVTTSSGGITGTGGIAGTGGTIGTGGTASSGGTTTSQGGTGGINPFAGGTSGSMGGATSAGGTTTVTSTPTGTTVAFAAGKAQGAMVGYGFVASGSSDPITDPTCGATKAPISTATPCAADPNWSATDKLCISGSIPALGTPPDYTANYGIVVGVNAGDPSGTLGQAFTTMTMTATGLPTGTVRAQVHVKGDSTSYCMTYSASAMTLAKFATDCYNTTPLLLIPAASMANIDKISLEAVSGTAAVTVTSMCITGITFAK
jgi:hypothetical protein